MRRNGFTLIEILACILIISVICSILIPTLSKSRNTALNIKCKTNVRSVSTALIMYSDTYKEFFPYLDGYPNVMPVDLNQDICNHLKDFLNAPDINKNIKLDPWSCPFDKDSFYPYFGNSYFYWAGNLRYLYETGGSSGYQITKIMKVYEYNPKIQIWGDYENPINHPNNIRNYGYFDGSVLEYK